MMMPKGNGNCTGSNLLRIIQILGIAVVKLTGLVAAPGVKDSVGYCTGGVAAGKYRACALN